MSSRTEHLPVYRVCHIDDRHAVLDFEEFTALTDDVATMISEEICAREHWTSYELWQGARLLGLGR